MLKTTFISREESVNEIPNDDHSPGPGHRPGRVPSDVHGAAAERERVQGGSVAPLPGSEFQEPGASSLAGLSDLATRLELRHGDAAIELERPAEGLKREWRIVKPLSVGGRFRRRHRHSSARSNS